MSLCAASQAKTRSDDDDDDEQYVSLAFFSRCISQAQCREMHFAKQLVGLRLN